MPPNNPNMPLPDADPTAVIPELSRIARAGQFVGRVAMSMMPALFYPVVYEEVQSPIAYIPQQRNE